MVVLIDPIHEWVGGAGLDMRFARAHSGCDAERPIVDQLGRLHGIAATRACRKVAEIVVGGKPASPGPVESGEDRAVGQVDERVVVDHPVVRYARADRRDDAVPQARTPIRVPLMPHQHVPVNLPIVALAGPSSRTHTYEESSAFDVLETIVTNDVRTIGIDRTGIAAAASCRAVACSISKTLRMMLAVAVIAGDGVVLKGEIARLPIVL